MADENVVKVTTGPTFTQDGVLVPPNTPIQVSSDIAQAEADNAKENKVASALRDFDQREFANQVPVAVAAIGPTGPNPTQPQALPPGAYQTPGGYADATGVPLVAETTNTPAAPAGEPVVEEGGPATAKTQEPDALDQSVEKLTAHLETVNDPAEIDRLIAAEKGGKSRAGALSALDDRKKALALS